MWDYLAIAAIVGLIASAVVGSAAADLRRTAWTRPAHPRHARVAAGTPVGTPESAAPDTPDGAMPTQDANRGQRCVT